MESKFRVNNYINNNEQVVQSPFDPNQAMRFDDKTDEEFINSSDYKTNLTIEELISNPEPKRKNKRGKIPRRLNSWIIYRRDKCSLFKGKGLIAEIITEEVRKMWAEEPEEVKEFYAALSRLAVKKHIKIYGQEYKYKPGPYKKTKKTKKTKSKLSPSSEESFPNISTTSSSSSTPSESMQLPSDMISGFSFFPTPESIPDSPATSSVSGSDDSDVSLGLEQAFPPLSAISRSKPPSDITFESLFQIPSSIPNFDDFSDANAPLFDISYWVDANTLKFPTVQLPEPEESLFVDMNAATPSHSAFDKLLSTFTDEQIQLYSEVVQLPIEHDHDLYPSKENPQDDSFLANSQIEHQELLNANMQHNLMVYNDIQPYADSTNLMDNNDVYDWLLYDVVDTFDYLARDPREPSL